MEVVAQVIILSEQRQSIHIDIFHVEHVTSRFHVIWFEIFLECSTCMQFCGKRQKYVIGQLSLSITGILISGTILHIVPSVACGFNALCEKATFEAIIFHLHASGFKLGLRLGHHISNLPTEIRSLPPLANGYFMDILPPVVDTSLDLPNSSTRILNALLDWSSILRPVD